MTLRDRLEELRTRWRRWRLLRAYASVFEARTGKSVGFTPLMAAYERAERDGVLEVVDGEVRWHWPEDVVDDGEAQSSSLR